MQQLLLRLLILSLIGCCLCEGLGCLDENGNPVDWWIIMKYPELTASQDANAASGFGYAYADIQSPALQDSNHRLDVNLQGALGSTLGQIYSADKGKVGWLIYNDESYDGANHEDYGHTKGDIAFDSTGGFWLVHSVPRFPAPATDTYSFPIDERIYGQSFLCISVGIGMINNIGEQFLLNKPFVYDNNLPDSLTNLVPNIVSVINGQFLTSSATNVMNITSVGGKKFTTFAKNSEWNNDLYQYLVQPYYFSGLLIETWMNGATADKMPSYCQPNYKHDSINIRQVQINININWKETDDHSKWAVSTNNDAAINNIYCIGDINRQFSQAKRGGGTVCAQDTEIRGSLFGLIVKSDSC